METGQAKFINHENKEILLVDLSNTASEDVLKIIEDANQLISTKPKHSVLTLIDITNTRFDESVGDLMKEFSLHKIPYEKAGAVVGMTRLKKIIFGAVTAFSGKKLESFDDREQAKLWLIND